MSVIGIDFGGSNSRVAAAGKGGVDVLLNAISKRDNATVVSFGPKERHIGEAGLDLEVRNARNTVRSVKRFIGMHSEAEAVASERDYLTCGIDSDDTESVNFAVQYNDAYQTFRPEQILAMMLTQLKGIAVSNLPSAGQAARPSCVLSCPAYYTQNQKQALLNACDIADIPCLGLLNETTAAAVDYGIFKIKEFPEDITKPGAVVCFIDVGHTATTASIVSFYASEMKVIATCFDENLGCRNIDNLLLHHFRDVILKKHRIDVFENKKARIRLTQACQKVKTTLSANPVTSLSLECLMEDIDVHFPSFKREQLEELIQEFSENYEVLCQRIVQQYVNFAGEGADVSSLPVELIGGGSRIPIVKKITQNVFGSAPRTTLNATETISKGCAIHAAMLSPSYRVRDYKISDVAVYPAKIGYFSPIAPPAHANQREVYHFLPNDINKIINIIKPGDALPKALDISFEREENFEVFTFYDHSGNGVLNRKRVLSNQLLLNHSTVTNVTGDATQVENVISRHNKVKLRFKVSLVGSIDIVSAQVITEYDREIDEMQPDENSEDAPPQEKRTKKERKTSQAFIERHAITDGMTADMVLQAKALEKDMCAQDALVQRTAEARNSLETCFYEYRYKIVDRDGELNKFTPPDSIPTFDSMCAEASAWLESEEGEDANLEAFMSRLAPMQAIVNGAVARMRNFEGLPISLTEFEAKLNSFRAEQSTIKTQENGGWHSDEELGRLESLLNDIESWYQSKKIDNAAQQLFADPILTPEVLAGKLKEQERTIINLLRKPKPIPKPQPKKETPEESAPKEKEESAETAPERTETE